MIFYSLAWWWCCCFCPCLRLSNSPFPLCVGNWFIIISAPLLTAASLHTNSSRRCFARMLLLVGRSRGVAGHPTRPQHALHHYHHQQGRPRQNAFSFFILLLLVRNAYWIRSRTTKETSRKFRIRFQSTDQEPAETVAYTCARHLSTYLTLHDADRQGQDAEDSNHQQQACTVTFQQLAQAVLNPQQSKWPPSKWEAETPSSFASLYNWIVSFLMALSDSSFVYIGLGYAGVGSVPELDSDLVRSCLMDPNFPALVQAVENSMRKLMSPAQEYWDRKHWSHQEF